jgi:hypothetical protein
LAVSVEPDLIGDVLTFDLPGIAVREPEIGNFNLIAITNRLLKDTVVVPDAVAPGRNLQSSE